MRIVAVATVILLIFVKINIFSFFLILGSWDKVYILSGAYRQIGIQKYSLTQRRNQNMKLEKFAQEVRNSTELIVIEQPGQLRIEALEAELAHELEQVTADIDYIDNLEYHRADEITLIINEVE